MSSSLWFFTQHANANDQRTTLAAYRTKDAGTSWASNLTNCVDITRDAAGNLYALKTATGANTDPPLLYKSIDDGDNWTLHYTFTVGGTAYTPCLVVAHPSDPNKLFCLFNRFTEVNVYRAYSSNAGVSWTIDDTGFDDTGDLQEMMAVWLTNGRIVVTVRNAFVVTIRVTDDFGDTFTTKRSEDGVTFAFYKYTSLGGDTTKLVALREDLTPATDDYSPLVSTDSGGTWTLLDKNLNVAAGLTVTRVIVSVYDRATDTLYAGYAGTTDKWIWKLSPVSADGEWENLSSGFGADDVYEDSMAVIP